LALIPGRVGQMVGVIVAIIMHSMLGGWVFGSPIMNYVSESVATEQSFHSMHLRYVKTTDAMPLLRGICQHCSWVVEHSWQMVGLHCSASDWAMYRAAILTIDRKPVMIGLDIDVVEISNIESSRYQQLLSHLASPMRLNDTIDGLIQLLVSSGNATIVSSPKLMGRSGKKIILNVGDKVPYKTAVHHASTIQSNVQYIQSGIQLAITPHLHYYQSIDLHIELTYNVVNGYRNEGGVEMPIIASRESQVDIQVDAGEQVAFAGLLDQSVHENIEKVPFFGDIPLVGVLFQRRIKNGRSTDLIYKIRPYTIK
jgi:Flp pilus assembly secretin CpaC